jgi:hypothetical protein
MSISSLDAVHSNGYAIVRGFAPQCSSSDVAHQLGEVDSVEGLGIVQSLIPRALDEAEPNTYSGNFGLSEFPLHTDLAHWATPPRYLMLRCIRGDPKIVTPILDAKEVVAGVGAAGLGIPLARARSGASLRVFRGCCCFFKTGAGVAGRNKAR